MPSKRRASKKRIRNNRTAPPSDDPPAYHARGYPFDLRFTASALSANKESTWQVKHIIPYFKSDLSIEPHVFKVHRVTVWSMHQIASIGIRTYNLQIGNNIHRTVIDQPGKTTYAHVSAPVGGSNVELSSANGDVSVFTLGTDTDNVNPHIRIQGVWYSEPLNLTTLMKKNKMPVVTTPVTISDVIKAMDTRYALKKDAKSLPALS